MDLPFLTSIVSRGQSLESAQAEAAADLLASPEPPDADKAAFLVALSAKGETAEEVSGIARRFRDLARDPGLEEWRERAIDVCGTGGDKLGTFNISTTVTFVLAAAGVPVFKHGNRTITSKCGSANLLEALGVDLMADDATLRRSMQELGFCFMFAPAFHPAFKQIMPVRQSMAAAGQRSVFNVLGPLLNPARPAFQLLGVFDYALVEILAGALDQLGLDGGYVAHCRIDPKRGLDELSAAGENRVRGFGARRSVDALWSARDLGVEPATLDELRGGELSDNIDLLEALLEGRAPRGLEDTVAVNVAAAFQIVGRHETIAEGVPEARDLLLGGATREKLEQTKEFFATA